MENKGENSGPLTSLQVDRLTATDCNAAARAKNKKPGVPKIPYFICLQMQARGSCLSIIPVQKSNIQRLRNIYIIQRKI